MRARTSRSRGVSRRSRVTALPALVGRSARARSTAWATSLGPPVLGRVEDAGEHLVGGETPSRLDGDGGEVGAFGAERLCEVREPWVERHDSHELLA